jgi:hypothetical protein
VGGWSEADASELGNRFAEGQVRDVDGHDGDLVGDDVRTGGGDVRRLEVDDAGVLAEGAQQLAVPTSRA